MTSEKVAYVDKELFVSRQEYDDLGDVKVRIWNRFWQSSSGWYSTDQVERAWKEAESKLPFAFQWEQVKAVQP